MRASLNPPRRRSGSWMSLRGTSRPKAFSTRKTSRGSSKRNERTSRLSHGKTLCGRLLAFAQHEIKIAQIDKQAEPLPRDEHRVAAVQRIGKQQYATADREDPERGRDNAAAGALGGDPLHQEAHGKQRLRQKAERDPSVELEDEHVMQIVLNRAQHSNLRNLRHLFAAADEPPHAGQIQDANPEAV